MMTFCCAVLALSANWMGLLLVPIGPVVSSVTVAPVVAISAAVLLALAATMPPVPAVRLIVPPLPFERRAGARAVVEDDLARAGGVLDDHGRCAGGGGRRGGREGDVAGLGAVADGDRAGGGRIDLGQFGVGQVDAGHGVVRAAQAHRPASAATSG